MKDLYIQYCKNEKKTLKKKVKSKKYSSKNNGHNNNNNEESKADIDDYEINNVIEAKNVIQGVFVTNHIIIVLYYSHLTINVLT